MEFCSTVNSANCATGAVTLQRRAVKYDIDGSNVCRRTMVSLTLIARNRFSFAGCPPTLGRRVSAGQPARHGRIAAESTPAAILQKYSAGERLTFVAMGGENKQLKL